MLTYRRTEPQLWTVFDGDEPMRDFRTEAEAADYVARASNPSGWARVDALERRVAELERRLSEHGHGLPDSISWALNSGDGVYRP